MTLTQMSKTITVALKLQLEAIWEVGNEDLLQSHYTFNITSWLPVLILMTLLCSCTGNSSKFGKCKSGRRSHSSTIQMLETQYHLFRFSLLSCYQISSVFGHSHNKFVTIFPGRPAYECWWLGGVVLSSVYNIWIYPLTNCGVLCRNNISISARHALSSHHTSYTQTQERLVTGGGTAQVSEGRDISASSVPREGNQMNYTSGVSIGVGPSA